MAIIIVPGPDPTSRAFASSLAKTAGLSLCDVSYKRFPDGEQYIRLGCETKGSDVIVVKTFVPEQDSSAVIAMLLADAAKEAGANSLTLIAPYIAYARQDRAFLSGEPVSIRALLRALWASGYERLVTIEIHKPESLRHFPGSSINVRPYPLMADLLSLRGRSDVVVVSPDLGALERAKILASHLGVEFDYLEKFRDRVTGEVSMKPKSMDVKDKHVIIVDDIISTGSTIVNAVNELRKQGARDFTVLVAHALLAEGAEERLRSIGLGTVYAANTTPVKGSFVTQIDVAPAVAESLKSLGLSP